MAVVYHIGRKKIKLYQGGNTRTWNKYTISMKIHRNDDKLLKSIIKKFFLRNFFLVKTF